MELNKKLFSKNLKHFFEKTGIHNKMDQRKKLARKRKYTPLKKKLNFYINPNFHTIMIIKKL